MDKIGSFLWIRLYFVMKNYWIYDAKKKDYFKVNCTAHKKYFLPGLCLCLLKTYVAVKHNNKHVKFLVRTAKC